MGGIDPTAPSPTNAFIAASGPEWRTYESRCLAVNECPYSGLPGPECKRHICDCVSYEDRWGVSQS